MGNKSKQRRRAHQQHRKALKKLLASVGGQLYLNMESQEWLTGKVHGVDVRGHCIGYRVPRGTTPQEEAACLKKWREMDAIFFPKPQQQVKPAAKPTPPKKKQPQKQKTKKLRLKVAEVQLELVGTEL